MIQSPGRNAGLFDLLRQLDQIKQRKVSLLDALWQVRNSLCTPAQCAQMIGAHYIMRASVSYGMPQTCP
jgi:hypothetical protein